MRSRWRTFFPCRRTSPPVGSMRRFTVRRRVVFPEPLRPRTAVVVPSSTANSTWSSSKRPRGVANDRSRNSIAVLIRFRAAEESLAGICVDSFWLTPSAVALPHILESFRQRLFSRLAIYVARIASKDKLVVIALGREHSRHPLIGQHPVVHVIAHHVRVQQIPVAHFHPDAQGLARAVWNEVLVEFPRAMRHLRIPRPLLIHKRP